MSNAKIHAALLELLQAFDAICAREKLVYMLTAGTLLGAVREKGFIEWDVDVDLMMHRHDYDAFESCSEKYLPSLGLSLRYADRVPRVYRTDNPSCNAEILIIDALPQITWKRSYKVFMLKLLQGMSKQKIDYRRYSFKSRLLLSAASLLGSEPGTAEKWSELEISALNETGNILGCAYVNAITRLINRPLIPSVPFFIQDYGASVVEQAVLDEKLREHRCEEPAGHQGHTVSGRGG